MHASKKRTVELHKEKGQELSLASTRLRHGIFDMAMASIESLVLQACLDAARQQSSISCLGDRTPEDAACPGKFARTASKHVLVFI
jgi:hypothetical protein